MKKREYTFRKGALCVTASLACIGVFIAFTIGAVSDANGSFIFGAFVLSLFMYFFWLLGWQSAVRIDSYGVRVDNLLFRHYIPWGDLADIGVGGGLEFRLCNGGKVFSLMYGGSIIGQVLGDRYTKRVAARMRAACQDVSAKADAEVGEPLAYNSRFYMEPWPPVVILVAMELVAVLGLVTR